MTPYRAQHADLFRTVAEILIRDYIAPGETEDTVNEFFLTFLDDDPPCEAIISMEPSELAELIADVEGYEKR